MAALPPGAPRGTVPSPNIWEHTGTYELENLAVDRGLLLERTMRHVADWDGRTLLDLGCGSGFHLRRWAEPGPAHAPGGAAARVVGVEPHPALAALARRRARGLPHVSVAVGSAQEVPLPDASVDVVHARWAYFFGPGCEPGLRELSRVVRRGGTAFVIDNDASRSTFGAWFRRGYPKVDPPAVVERFWTSHGWTREPLLVAWEFDRREDLEAVVRIELDPATADAVLAEHEGLVVDYAVNLWWRRF
ncbi:class I SAM-dependent methyltransferase [Nocardioides zeae]|uniref:Class I SAM-dependent methyltransferase n=1 Tax=Nocardioides imazamoxiresistens TaxID=3231893 RepID=A0ABU3PZW0_9ACTN|nr:class I SAM-dependent methyltransferase [Nocardioides zeae]MDT9594785.1 class I SAM-dependent methyltransferase [Nocardioides zeae]